MIQIRNIHKTFGNNTILRGVDLDVAKGQVVVILGPSGSGKTTFLRCLNALEIPEQGSICFEREPIVSINFATQHSKKDILALRRKSGMVFQQYNLFPHKTALENIMEAPVQVQGKPKAQAREEALALLAKVGLADKADLYPYQLSGGQQQRVGIARALALQPDESPRHRRLDDDCGYPRNQVRAGCRRRGGGDGRRRDCGTRLARNPVRQPAA